jgi:hypothetical protein
MAYLRNEKETIEVDYPLDKIWAAIPEAVTILEWKIEEKNDSNHNLKIKTKGGFMAYGSKLDVELKAVDKNTSRISINAETPVTTITSIIDFGRTRDRMGQFIEILAKLMEKKKLKVDRSKPKI